MTLHMLSNPISLPSDAEKVSYAERSSFLAADHLPKSPSFLIFGSPFSNTLTTFLTFQHPTMSVSQTFIFFTFAQLTYTFPKYSNVVFFSLILFFVQMSPSQREFSWLPYLKVFLASLVSTSLCYLSSQCSFTDVMFSLLTCLSANSLIKCNINEVGNLLWSSLPPWHLDSAWYIANVQTYQAYWVNC